MLVRVDLEPLTTVLWTCPWPGAERCVLARRRDGFSLTGTALLPEEGVPVELRYSVVVDGDWRTREVAVDLSGGEEREPIRLPASWWDGDRPPAFARCLEVDLAFSPSTNTLPIRRLRLEPGESADVEAAWLRFPELDVVPLMQRYERLGPDRWRYGSNGFSAELTVDEHGIVVEYADLWRAVARG
jgi:hypothetical protein